MKSKLFARYVSLSVIGMIFLSAYILADTFFISLGVGSNGLTALNIILPLFNLLNGLGLLIGFGGGSRYIIHKSQGDDIKANKVFMTSLYLALLFSIFFIISGFFASDILKFFSAEGKVLELGTTYLSVMFFFSPAFLSITSYGWSNRRISKQCIIRLYFYLSFKNGDIRSYFSDWFITNNLYFNNDDSFYSKEKRI